MTLPEQMKLLNFLLKHDKEATVETYIREAKEFELRGRTREARLLKGLEKEVVREKVIISSEDKIKIKKWDKQRQ